MIMELRPRSLRGQNNSHKWLQTLTAAIPSASFDGRKDLNVEEILVDENLRLGWRYLPAALTLALAFLQLNDRNIHSSLNPLDLSQGHWVAGWVPFGSDPVLVEQVILKWFYFPNGAWSGVSKS